MPRRRAIEACIVIPIRDINHTRRTPIVTWALIGANVLIFVGFVFNALVIYYSWTWTAA